MSVQPRKSLSARLATLYASIFAVTVLVVIVASSIALVYELSLFSNDIIVAKHQEARFLTGRYQAEGQSLAQSAPRLVSALSGIGFRVAVYDDKGRFLGGDKSVHPRILDRVVAGSVKLTPPREVIEHAVRGERPSILRAPIAGPPPPGAQPPSPHDWWRIVAVNGGYVTFDAAPGIILVNLIPYWWIIFGIAVVAIAVSWLIGRVFARQALAPVNEITGSLRALADGDYTQRRFVTAAGDEIATLTQAYNEAAASVAIAMQERRETEARMRQFVADAGHELRTPLTVIAGYIDVLRRGAIDEPTVAKQILGTMALEKEHMRTLIDRLMRLARMDSETPPERAPIDVGDLIRRQVDAARRMDERRAIDYSIDGVKEIVGDRAEISEALWNVIENALKYAPGAPIHVRAYRDNGTAILSVQDEGPGMSEAERLHAFERFYRGDARGEIAGTGLGLSIAKRAIDRAGGSIDIDSAPGSGTTVSIKLQS
ncbi:MAG TPA: HAMP domain-containing sensor histidine kinase [Candidatus Baltobacteraceae bacterium]|jgi:signal transduction histidine kinase|nr:HAMP domain-containing sensor histidine kinase [Candidatus Baltobacteraceae bacterium]